MNDPQTVMRAHQYLYYVKGTPVISDYDYDMYCKENGLFGGGGSDMEADYSIDEIRLAETMLAESR